MKYKLSKFSVLLDHITWIRSCSSFPLGDWGWFGEVFWEILNNVLPILSHILRNLIFNPYKGFIIIFSFINRQADSDRIANCHSYGEHSEFSILCTKYDSIKYIRMKLTNCSAHIYFCGSLSFNVWIMREIFSFFQWQQYLLFKYKPPVCNHFVYKYVPIASVLQRWEKHGTRFNSPLGKRETVTSIPGCEINKSSNR